MPDLESHWLAERLVYLGRSLLRDMVWGQEMRVVFPRLKSNPEVEGIKLASAVWPSVNLLGPVTFLDPERNCIGS